MFGVQYDGSGPALGELNNIFQRILGRDADAEGLAYWDKTNASYQDVERSVANSDEAAQRLFSQIQYDGQGPGLADINAVYRELLGRNADAGGLQSFDKANLTPEQIRREILKSDEYADKNPEAGKVRQLKKIVEWEKKKQTLDEYRPETDEGGQVIWNGRPGPENPGEKPDGDKKEILRSLINSGVDLSGIYGDTWGDAAKFMQDLGIYGGKDSNFLPANPVGYSGGFKFDPNFGTAHYRDLALAAGKSLGLSEQDVIKLGSAYFSEKLYSDKGRQGGIGFTDLGEGLITKLSRVAVGRNLAASGQLFVDDGDNGGAVITPEYLRAYEGDLRDDSPFARAIDKKIEELNLRPSLQPLYDANAKVYSGLSSAARVESKSSGFFKQIGASIAKLGPIGTIALTAALGPAGAGLSAVGAAAAAAALPSALQGDFSGALKSGALAGLSSGVFKGLDATISNSVGGGITGDIVGGAAKGAITGGAGALITGGDIGEGLINGAITGGTVAGVTSGVNALTGPGQAAVGGIDDSNNDLGKSAGFLQDYGGTPVGDFDPNSYDEMIRGITGQQPPIQSEIGGGVTQTVDRDSVGNVLGTTSTTSGAPIDYTPSIGDFDIDNYDKTISGISGTDLSGSDFGGGLAVNSGAPVGGGATQFVNRDDAGNVTGTTVETSGPSDGFGVSEPTPRGPQTGLGNVIGPIAGGLIANELIGDKGGSQSSGGSVQPAPTVTQPETTQPRGEFGVLPRGAFTTNQPSAAGNQKAARLNLGSLLSGSKFAENNKYLRGFF